MTKIKAYANYGVLAAEKMTVYTVAGKHEHATVSEKVEIVLPEEWTTSENTIGQMMIESPDGKTWLADDVISTAADGETPQLDWYNSPVERHRIKMQISEGWDNE